jgi:putative phosphoesterase
MNPRRASTRPVRVGVISDTHGLLRPEAVEALRGSDVILHAGDVGGQSVLDGLGALASVVAVRGNNDQAPWAFALPDTQRVQLGGLSIFVLHDVKDLAFEPRDEGIAVVVCGHSHQPSVSRRDDALWVNPGSAGPRRFKLPVGIARMVIADGVARAELVSLDGRTRLA